MIADRSKRRQVSPMGMDSSSPRIVGNRSTISETKRKYLFELGSIRHPQRERRNRRRKRERPPVPFWCKAVLLPMLLMLFLLGLGIGIYAMVRYIRPTSATSITLSTATSATTTTRILNWNTTGLTLAGVAGSPGSSANRLNLPVDLALDAFNNMYIADYRNSRIQKWTIGGASGTTVAGFGNGSLGNTSEALYTPPGVFIDSSNRIFIGDSGNHRVQLWLNGASSGTTIAGTTGVSGSSNTTLYHPYGVVYDSATNRIYIAEFLNHRISSYVVGASSGTVVAGGNGPGNNSNQLSHPVALYLDSATNSLLICNNRAHTIVRWTLGASTWTLVAGTPGVSGNSATLLNGPSSVTMDSMGNIYVADTENHRIQFFATGQSIGRTIAGVTGVNGTAAHLLQRPYTVRIDHQLNLYVTDTENHRIQKFFVY